MSEDDHWDAFVSYASEDRGAVAKPLSQLLIHLGLHVWYDEEELKVGDSLRQRIDDGLSRSRYGIVVLSESFFGKHYPERELSGLAQKEVDGRKVILPVWHGVDAQRVRAFSLPLADRVAVPWDIGIYEVALRLLATIRPDVADEIRRAASKLRPLEQVLSGKRLAEIVANAHGHQFFNDSSETRDEMEAVASFLQQMQDWGDIWGDLEAGAHVEAEFSMQEALRELSARGWAVYGERRKARYKIGQQVMEDWEMSVIAVVRAGSTVFFDGKSIAVLRGPSQDAPHGSA
jgi:hypothetical protein